MSLLNKIPVSFSGFTVKEFLAYKEIEGSNNLNDAEKITKLLSMLTGESEDYLDALDFLEINPLIKRLGLLNGSSMNFPPKQFIKVNGVKYRGALNLGSLSLVRVKALRTLKVDPDNFNDMCKVLAIVYAPYEWKFQGMFGDISILPRRVDVFKRATISLADELSQIENELREHAKISDVLGLILNYYTRLEKYLEIAKQSIMKAHEQVSALNSKINSENGNITPETEKQIIKTISELESNLDIQKTSTNR